MIPKEVFIRERRNSCTTTSPRPPQISVPEKAWVSEVQVNSGDIIVENRGLEHLKPNRNFSVSEISQSARSLQSNFTVHTERSLYSSVNGAPSLNEDFFELLNKHMSDRFDDQRASLPAVKEEVRSPGPSNNPITSSNRPHVTSPEAHVHNPENQVSHYPPPVTRSFQTTPLRPKPKRPAKQDTACTTNRSPFMPPISHNIKRNGTKLGSASSEIWTPVKSNNSAFNSRTSVTTESEENFFQLISRMQGNRLDDQRCAMPSKVKL